VATNTTELKGDDLFYSYISDYLDGELPGGIQAQFTALLSGREKEIETFQANRGKFQSALGEIGGSEALKHKLRNLAQDDQARETIEASEIAEVERSEFWTNLLRRSVLIAMVLGIIGLGLYYFMPERMGAEDIIQYIGQEALAMEDDPEGRTNLPSSDLEEIRQFVKTIPGLEFRPSVLRPLNGWNPEGVSIIDYDFMKVVAINYISPERGNEHVHHFMIPGKLSDIKFTGEEADYRGIKYRVYSNTESINVLLWQQTPEMVSALAGRRSAPEMAEIARAGTPE